MKKVTKTEFVNSVTKGVKGTLKEKATYATIAKDAYNEEVKIHREFMQKPSSKNVKKTLKNKALKIEKDYLKYLKEKKSSKDYILSTQNFIELIEKDKFNNTQLNHIIDFPPLML